MSTCIPANRIKTICLFDPLHNSPSRLRMEEELSTHHP